MRWKVNLSSRSRKVSVDSRVPTGSTMPGCRHKVNVNRARSTQNAWTKVEGCVGIVHARQRMHQCNRLACIVVAMPEHTGGKLDDRYMASAAMLSLKTRLDVEVMVVEK